MIHQPLHVVLGASGGAGYAIVQALVDQGKRVRAVTSQGKALINLHVDVVQADATDVEQLQQACEGASYIYHCLNVPYMKWSEILPIFTRNVIHVAQSTHAKLIYIDNMYAYGPVDVPMTEDLPHNATDTKGKLRGIIADQYLEAHRTGKIQIVIVRGADFFGPNTASGMLVFKKALAHQSAQNIGNPTHLHTYTYIKDFGNVCVFLAQQEVAYGQIWHAPNTKTISTQQLIDMIYQDVGYETKISNLSKYMLRFLGLWMPLMRELYPLYYQHDRDYIVDHTKFTQQFGPFVLTPLKQAIHETLERYRHHD